MPCYNYLPITFIIKNPPVPGTHVPHLGFNPPISYKQ